MGEMSAKPLIRSGIGIVSPYGQFWSTEIFDTEAAAREYIARVRLPPDSFRYIRAVLKISEAAPTRPGEPL